MFRLRLQVIIKQITDFTEFWINYKLRISLFNINKYFYTKKLSIFMQLYQ